MTKQITKSIRLNPTEDALLKALSEHEGVSESTLLKQYVRAGMQAARLEQAIEAYQRGEADLSGAAAFADISVYHMLTELKQRDIAPPVESEKFVAGLQTLVDTFGGSDALRATLALLADEAEAP